MSGPFPQDGDYVAFYRLLEDKPCTGNPDSAAHEYIEPLDTTEWHCQVCGDTGPYDGPYDFVSGQEYEHGQR